MGQEAEEFLQGIIIYYIVSFLEELIRIKMFVNVVSDINSKLVTCTAKCFKLTGYVFHKAFKTRYIPECMKFCSALSTVLLMRIQFFLGVMLSLGWCFLLF